MSLSSAKPLPSLPMEQLSSLHDGPPSAPPPAPPKRYWHLKTSHRPAGDRSMATQGDRRVSEKSAKSAKSDKSGKSSKSATTNSSKGSSAKRSRAKTLPKLPPVDLSLPLSKLADALDLAPLAAPASATKERRATKAAMALRSLILDAPNHDVTAFTLATMPAPPTPDLDHPGNTRQPIKLKGKASKIPQLREKDVERLRTQLLKPDEAKLVMASARSLPIPPASAASVERAVCLNCSEDQADTLIVEAKRIESVRQEKEKRWDRDHHRFSTLTASQAPPAPPRLPVLLSLFAGMTTAGAMPGTGADATIMTLGLFEPASAMSLHRPLAGALPSADTLRMGFDALMNAESKIYLYQGPSHKNIHPPTDRISVYTYWWGFELALPPPTMAYLAHAKSIATSILNLLSVIVYAVPGGTRELAPFVGVLSRFIENEWNLLKSQDRGKGVVCGATWFIPAALVARPWDFGEETIRDHLIHTEEEKELAKGKIPAAAIVKVKGEAGEAEGVVVGIGRGMNESVPAPTRKSPALKWKPSTPVAPNAPTTPDIDDGHTASTPPAERQCEKHAAETTQDGTPEAESSRVVANPSAPPTSPPVQVDSPSVIPPTKLKAKSKLASTLRPKQKKPSGPAGDSMPPLSPSGRVSPSTDTPPLVTPSEPGQTFPTPVIVDDAGSGELGTGGGLPVINALSVSRTLGAKTLRLLKGKKGSLAQGQAKGKENEQNLQDLSVQGEPRKSRRLQVRRSQSRST